jgi:putative hydrolase of the HAD superfamily
MPSPSAVVFDLGKVLVDFDYSIAGRRIARRGKMPAAEVQRYLDHSPLLVRYETGEINRQEFFEIVRQHTGFDGSLAEFGSFFGQIFTPVEPMIALHATLRQHGYPTYIFSNTNDLAVDEVTASFPFFRNFTGYILSYQVGAMKPDAKIYEALEALANKRDVEIVYLDDRAENIAGGIKRGWQTILHESPAQSLAALQRMGLPV